MTMSDAVRVEYERILALVIIERGSVVTDVDAYYGWADYNATTHMRDCDITSHGVPDEDTWSEFKSTFYEGDTSEHGVLVGGVTCRCGTISERSVRWRASVSEIAEAVFAVAYGVWQTVSDDVDE